MSPLWQASLGYAGDLEHTYGLLYNFRDQEPALAKAVEITQKSAGKGRMAEKTGHLFKRQTQCNPVPAYGLWKPILRVFLPCRKR